MYTRPRSRLIWLPLILGGSVLYWTLAFGLGGMSLTFLSGSNQEDLELDVRPVAADTEEPIVVHIEEPIMVRLQTLSEARAAGVVIEARNTDTAATDTAATDEDETAVTDVTPSPQPGDDTVGQTAF